MSNSTTHTTHIITEFGDECFYKDGKLHREDGPAMINRHGTKWWYKNGILHREDGPAIEHIDGTKLWFRNGKQCDENGLGIESNYEKMINTIKNGINITIESFISDDGKEKWYIDGDIAINL